ncbi:DnaJ C-terminal domain-containing protein [Nitrosomonas sp. Is35]|uniref:DnaJ C-terminal domain-containing protein n=1 Tax=unclassified Nitrosomonas TaxID=2609265 RepID=UPI00294B37E3|nr:MULTISPECIES: DnaJ C-terminal domain-containing protein [unclassified Nitrosomonas]MDV6342247.1 DnaJ C-terminal domain-containing protein [Nitrosomonas sp. Is24]MDV6348154.1 DnaJ C-terminal domain-containing protein [Nitrosomonas sp. Is35]
MEFKDYYKTLGVSRDATAEEIKKSFRRLARKYHPDVSKETDAEHKMQEINEANAVLSDPEKRAAYDQLGQGGFQPGSDFQPPPGWDSNFEFRGRGFNGAQAADFSDFFAELFGGGMGAGTRHTHQRKRGEDHHAKIMLDLEDSYHGTTRSLTLRMPKLDDQGRTVLAEHTLNVRIPKGVHAGQVIRLAGQGGPGHAGEAAGDLFLEVHFKPHSRYRIENKDVYATLPVAPWEAMLGATIKIPVPDGQVEVRVPENSQSGRKLRLKGRGIPAATPGDLYLVLEVVLPPATGEKERTFYQTMAQELAFNPRQNLGV